ncbi:FadR/GntR family transcriptional regulator [Nocardia sp. alder85J]|uniref:FadR/GntR family transcriptional regulator n=1 Tax=Nocardia sp. alder85J TaxID=2862949 RepID=UPI001CD44A92|nr:FCD domain-containing protein [Nocardia sp. alder85J]MCX4097579.1 FCD domain-containing protein [Nocardia sp. alder85J]
MERSVGERVSGARANQRALREAVKGLIVARGLGPGASLPTESELMKELGVSRHPLREAMKALEAVGIVDIRHGYGTYVGAGPLSGLEAGLAFHGALSVRGDYTDIRNLFEVREVLEAGLVSRVLAARDRLDLAALTDAVTAMEEAAQRGDPAPDQDWRFHEALYRPLGNELILDLIQVFWRVFAELDPALTGPAAAPETIARRHRAILDAVRAGDEPALRLATDEHFRGIRERLAVQPAAVDRAPNGG